MDNHETTNKNNRTVKPRTENNTKYHGQKHQRKPKKYHEECFATENKPPKTTDRNPLPTTERYKEDKSTNSKPTNDKKQCTKHEKANSRLKRKPRVEDRAFEEGVQQKTTNGINLSNKSHHQKNCSKYSDCKGKRYSGEITRTDEKLHIRKKEVLLPIAEGEHAVTKNGTQCRNKTAVNQRYEEVKGKAERDRKKHIRRKVRNEHTEERAEVVAASESRKNHKYRGSNEEKDKGQKHQKQREREKLKKENHRRKEASNTRNCYSDSEIDQTRTHISSCAATYRSRKSDESENYHHDGAKPINVAALYNFFYREESKASSIKKQQHENSTKKVEKAAIRFPDNSPKRKELIPEDRDAETESAECKQSSIRGKLIRVLFKRVKDLLKETEKLRDERKEFMTRIDRLTNQVSGLRLKEEEHVTSELRIKERLNVIANDIDVTEKGREFVEFVGIALLNRFFLNNAIYCEKPLACSSEATSILRLQHVLSLVVIA